MKENIFNYTYLELEEFFVKNNESKYRATQVFDWLYNKKEYNFDNYSNLNKRIIKLLKDNFVVDFIECIKVLDGTDVHKFLFKLKDGEKIEAVLMEHKYGLSVCVSSQVGCNMGCKFCESGRLKKVRNLEAYEIVLQIILIEEYIKKKINSVVVMGIGEPFDNYDNIIKFIRIINHPKALAIGSRHITVSTSGIVPKIYEFMNLDLQVNLAISLHAPNDLIRNELMPVNKVYNIDKLMSAINDYIKKTNRRVTIEYVMLNMVNDKISDAQMLAKLLKGMNVYVNLIPYNETSHIEFKKSSSERINAFYKTLASNNINVTVRRKYGDNIKAACGQLRSESD